MARAKWTTEQIEAALAEGRDLQRWEGGTPAEHQLAVLVDMAEWLLGEARAQRQAARQRLTEALASGERDPERLRFLTALANRGPADEDEDVGPALMASVALRERAAL